MLRNIEQGQVRVCSPVDKLDYFLLKHACAENVLRGVSELYVSIFDGFVNRLGGDLENPFRIGSEKAYSDNSIECPASLTQVSKADAAIQSWRADREHEPGSSPSSLEGRTGGKTPRRRGV